jgi:hypothetical protein
MPWNLVRLALGGLPGTLGDAVLDSFTETALDRVGSLSPEAPSGGFDSRRLHFLIARTPAT